MLELSGDDFSPLLKVWFGEVEAETMFRYLDFTCLHWLSSHNIQCLCGLSDGLASFTQCNCNLCLSSFK